MTILIAVSVTVFNIYGARRLPFFEGCILFFDIIGVFAILIPLWILAPMASSKEVWLDFGSYGGWKNLGLACLIGQLPSGGALIGADGESKNREPVYHRKGNANVEKLRHIWPKKSRTHRSSYRG